jgi:hypothetical protein
VKPSSLRAVIEVSEISVTVPCCTTSVRKPPASSVTTNSPWIGGAEFSKPPGPFAPGPSPPGPGIR